jgi:putative membrane protein insertion efficiency factor
MKALTSTIRFASLGAALALVRIYRILISPLVVAAAGPACRFQPTCSEYAHQALSIHGPVRGLYLTLRRILRCRPRGGWGYDPVPAPGAPKISGF